ncbi:MAG: alpha-L-fucosidase 2 [Kiritimatiellia bacterium]|jgi:alpha-L-fucosidase 2
MNKNSSTAEVFLFLGMMLVSVAGVSAAVKPEAANTAIGSGHGVIWFNTPAPETNPGWMQEAFPIGNGRLGCMVHGGIGRETIQFNEDTVWIGDESDTGAYQNFGYMYLDFAGDTNALQSVTGYRRELDINTSLMTIRYEMTGVKYRREYFASHPANVLVFRLSADKKGAYTGAITLQSTHKGTLKAEGNRIVMSGMVSGRFKKPDEIYDIVLAYEAQIVVQNEGGSLSIDDNRIVFKDCDSLLIMLDGGTDYLNERAKGWKREHPHARIMEGLANASKRPFDDLRNEHIKDYQQLASRVSLDLGETPDAARELPTVERLAAYKQGNTDPDLEELLFQYARYLMISSSRPGCMPANLQGLWNFRNKPAWRCDYHSDVNVQMNYWFVDAVNLSECFSPYAEWLHSIIPVRRKATQKEFGIRGWMTRSENGIFGGATYHWVPGDSAWLAQNIFDHYAFTLDQEYLKTRAYPIIKELCEGWEDFLKQGPDGALVSPASISPEHGPKAEGNSYEQQLVYDLFTNYIDLSKALGVDEAFRKKVETMRGRLLKPRIGKWGQLQEWAQDLDDPKDQHRHLSHLIAVHPGRQISPVTTPQLAEAAKVSMNARGDGATGWSKAWKIAIWARLHDGDRAYKLLGEFIRNNVYPNLYGFHPPFQIDCNFGYAAGVYEMLVQSHMGYIDLLPSLPKAWPAGSVQGLRVRGGYELDIEWKDGELTRTVIRNVSSPTGECAVRYGERTAEMVVPAGESREFKPTERND